MGALKYLFALWAGVLIYASLSIFFGAKGVSAYRQLEREQRKQEANIETLMQINQELEDSMVSLRYDQDTLAVFAREQGYASGSERFIRIVGLGLNQRIMTFTGDLVVAADPLYTPDRSIRIVALAAGITIFVCMAIFDILKFARERLTPQEADEADHLF